MFRLLPALCFLLLCSSCSKQAPDPTILKVGTQTWRVSQFKNSLNLYLKNLTSVEKSSPLNLKNLKKTHIQNLIFQALLEAWAKEKKVKLSIPRVSPEVKKVFYAQNILPQFLVNQKNNQALYDFFISYLFKKATPPTLKQQAKFYKKNRSTFYRSPGCFLKQILVPSKGIAETLHRQIKEGMSFDHFAKLYSKEQASLGWVTKQSSKHFFQACQRPLNHISPPLKSPYGYHIFRIEKKRKGFTPPFKQVQKKIIKILKKTQVKTAFQNWLQVEMNKTPIFIDQSLLDKIHIQYKK